MKYVLRQIFPSFLTLIAFLGLAFLYLPVITLMYISFRGGVVGVGDEIFSFNAYLELFNSYEIFEMITNSLIVAVSSAVLSLFIGTIFVCAMPAKSLQNFLPLFYINNAVPEVMIAGALTLLFASIKLPFGFGSLLAGHTLLGLGYVVPLVAARLQQLDVSLIEASLDLGATAQQTFFRIIVPAIMPALVASAALVFLISFDDLVISFFCAGSFWQTLPLYIFARLRTGVSPALTALSTLLILIGVVAVVFSQWLMKRYDQQEQE